MPEDGGTVDPPQDDMVKGAGRVDSGFTGHDNYLPLYPLNVNLSLSLFSIILKDPSARCIGLFPRTGENSSGRIDLRY
jgi:hypothetical protein